MVKYLIRSLNLVSPTANDIETTLRTHTHKNLNVQLEDRFHFAAFVTYPNDFASNSKVIAAQAGIIKT